MKKFFESLLKKLKQPRATFLLCFYALFALTVAKTVFLLAFVPEKAVFHYIFYFLSAVGLAYFVYAGIFLARKLRFAVIRILRKHPFTENILDSFGFRTLVFAAAGELINIAYAAFQTIVGIAVRSVWNIAIATFYFVLTALKGMVLFFGKKHKNNYRKQIKAYRACGYMLNLLTVAITGILILINKTNSSYTYAGYTIYAVAAYTFYKVISAITQFIRAKKQGSLIVRAIRNINLVGAFYSVLALQTAMNQAFGNGQNRFANNLTGGIIALFVLLISIYMIVKSYNPGDPDDTNTEKTFKQIQSD